MSSNVREMRREVQGLTGDIRAFVRAVDVANMSTATFLGYLARLGDEDMADLLITMQTFLITLQTIKTTLTSLEIQLGPIGWGLIIAGVLGGVAASHEMEIRRPRY